MSDFDLFAVASELNEKAKKHPIGQLQEIRKGLKQHKTRAGRNIFSSQTTFGHMAFHHGGRSELQFNIGKDGSDGTMLRHGIAFSFETSRTLPDIDVLRPKVRLFNEYLRHHLDEFAAMRMWHWEGSEYRSDNYSPGAIPEERVTEGIFVFLGRRVLFELLDYEAILDDFDALLPMYQYVEGGGLEQPEFMPTASSFAFQPGCSKKLQATVAKLSNTQLDVSLRHNVLQKALYQKLKSTFGAKNVGTELPSGVGTRIDVIVKRRNQYWYYEIKTALSPRACIREALGQLLEYSFWPDGQEAARLTVVGESPLDADGEKYLKQLRSRFSLPIHYEQVKAK